MTALFEEIRHSPLLWLLVLVPVVIVAHLVAPTAHTMLFVLSVAAIVPLAAMLSLATEAVASRTGDMVGGLLNATLGNLTELLIALAALRAGEYVLVKASIVGAIVTNSLFMLGASFLIGGFRYHVQEYNRSTARLQGGLLFLATIAMLVPSVLVDAGGAKNSEFTHTLSLWLSILLIVTYALGLIFSLGTHRELFASESHGEAGEKQWPISLALGTLAVVTVLVALVSEIFVESVQHARPRSGSRPPLSASSSWRWWGAPPKWFRHLPRHATTSSISASASRSAARFRLRCSWRRCWCFAAMSWVLLRWTCSSGRGAVTMMLIACITASLVTNAGRSAWFIGALIVTVYVIFAMTLYLLPPRT